MTLSTFVGKKLAGAHYGIEVEVEGMHGLHQRLQEDGEFSVGDYWRVISDGSLRNGGVEIVARRGIAEQSLLAALEELQQQLDNSPSYPYDEERDEMDSVSTSVRTSTHVHVNVLDLDFMGVFSMLVLGAAWEPLLQQYVNESRRQNLFCLPMFQCSSFQPALRHAYSRFTEGAFNEAYHALINIGKYSSMNTGRLGDLGTLEFRSMHGWPGTMPVLGWCEMLGRLKALCSQIVNVETLISTLLKSEEEVLELLQPPVYLPKQPGEPYLRLHETISMAFSLVSRAKTGSNEEHLTWRYSRHSDSPPAWASAAQSSFTAYCLPPMDMIHDALGTWDVGRTAFGITKVSPTAVQFDVCSKAEPTVLAFVINVSRPVSPVVLVDEVVTFSAEVF